MGINTDKCLTVNGKMYCWENTPTGHKAVVLQKQDLSKENNELTREQFVEFVKLLEQE